MRCPRTLSLLATGLLVAGFGGLAGCGTEAAGGRGLDPDATTTTNDGPTTTTTITTTTTVVGSPPPVALPSVGDLPLLAIDEPPVRITRCEVDPGDPERVLVEAVLVNVGSRHQVLQGVPITIRDEGGDGAVISAEGEDLWSSITIGPGRRALLRESVDADAATGGVACAPGESDLRDARRRRLDGLDAVALDGCSPIQVQVANPHDVEAGVEVVVEAFDEGGNSVGTFDLGQWPTEYTQPMGPLTEEDRALAPGATGRYEVDPSERIADWRTPTDGPVASCVVVAASVVPNPEPHLVIVD